MTISPGKLKSVRFNDETLRFKREQTHEIIHTSRFNLHYCYGVATLGPERNPAGAFHEIVLRRVIFWSLF